MLLIRNTENRYGTVAVGLHWLMAVLLISLVALGMYMVQLPDAGFDTRKITLILYHKDLGMLALALVILRLAWRVTGVLPALVARLPEWQKVVARFAHLSLYALMIALPVSGWLMSSAAGFPVTVLGILRVPDLIGHDDYLFQFFVAVHRWLSYALIALTGVHAVAALRHHFIFKDDTLRRMLASSPGPSSVSPPVPGRTRQLPAEPSP
jgi:cytochrome b561